MTPQPVSLRLLSGSASPAKAAPELPARLRLLEWGTNDTILGPVFLDDAAAATFAAAQRSIGRERVALDFEHNTVEGTAEWRHSPEPRRIAAQGRPVIHPGDGLYLEDLTWTETGTAHARDYEDISPALFLDGSGRVIGLHSAALTRTGATHGLTAFAATGELGAMLTTLSAGSVPAISNPSYMPDTAPPAADLAAITERLAALEALVKELAAAREQVTTLSAGISALEDRLKQSAATAAETERADLLAAAAKDGKVVPLSADTLKTIPTPALRELVEKLPKGLVPLAAGAAPNPSQGNGLKGLARVAAAINAQLGPKATK